MDKWFPIYNIVYIWGFLKMGVTPDHPFLILVGGARPPPLKNDGVRQLGWWQQPNINGKMKMATKPPTRIYTHTLIPCNWSFLLIKWWTYIHIYKSYSSMAFPRPIYWIILSRTLTGRSYVWSLCQNSRHVSWLSLNPHSKCPKKRAIPIFGLPIWRFPEIGIPPNHEF